VLHLPASAVDRIVAHALDCLPEECCGLLVGHPDDADGVAVSERFVPTTNVAASARVYTIDPREHLRTDREAGKEGLDVIGVVHSHTHTEPYPSPTDVAQAPDPGWHYVIVSLKRGEPELRSYRIVDGHISEEPIAVDGR
jgi:[CysO sulfur-carrier protein]-S-L-cysteine hydrolase